MLIDGMQIQLRNKKNTLVASSIHDVVHGYEASDQAIL